MIKKLRKQFVCIAMLSTALVLTVIIAGINIVNYADMRKNLDYKLQLISANGGVFPDVSLLFDPGAKPDDASFEGEDPPEKPDGEPDAVSPQEPAVEEGDESKLVKRGISEESPYTTRYFSVTIASDGSVSDSNTGQIAAVSESEAEDYAQSLYEKGKTGCYGYLNGYRYLAVQITDDSGSPQTLYVFIDSSAELRSVRSFLFVSAGISCLGLALVFVLVLIFSKIIVRPMAESYEKQKRFITDASHELKTPLTIIDANTEIMEMMEGENEWTQSIRKQTRRLTSLTEKLVFLSRMDEEATKPEMVDFSFSDVAEDVAEGFEAIAEAKGKTLTLHIQPQTTFHGDEKMIRQMISLLLDNAMKYSDVHGTIALKLESTGKSRTLNIKNTLDQIEPGDHPELFERFYRRDASHNSKTGGFGIGLSVVYAIVMAHKGKITAKSDDGKSLEFNIILPQ